MHCSVWGVCGSEDLDEDVVLEASVVLRDDDEERGLVLDPAPPPRCCNVRYCNV